MDAIFGLGGVAITSLLAFSFVRRPPAGRGPSLRYAFEVTLECIGTCAVFLGLNLAFGVVLVLLIRGLTPWFVSLYNVSDALVVVLSIFQGFIFHISWRSAPPTS